MIARSHPRSVRLAFAGLAATLALVTAPVTTVATTHAVKLGFNDFDPPSLTITGGDRVRWSNKGGILEHDVKSTAPARYFSSGPAGGMSPGDTYSFTFRSAGRFEYHCSIHSGMDGSVTVGIGVKRLYGPARFRITVATASAGGAWRHEVQVRRPGSSAWQQITRTTSASVIYTPSAHGTYRFRSRVTNVNTGADSEWSPVKTKTY